MLIDFDRKWNVNGKLMTRQEMTREDIENWEYCRDKLDYMYGHNYDHLPEDECRQAMLSVYQMHELPLNQEEKEILKQAKADQMRRYEASKQKEKEREQRKRARKYA